MASSTAAALPSQKGQPRKRKPVDRLVKVGPGDAVIVATSSGEVVYDGWDVRVGVTLRAGEPTVLLRPMAQQIVARGEAEIVNAPNGYMPVRTRTLKSKGRPWA